MPKNKNDQYPSKILATVTCEGIQNIDLLLYIFIALFMKSVTILTTLLKRPILSLKN